MNSTHQYRRCYHCNKHEALMHSNFCASCRGDNRPLFFPSDRRCSKTRKTVSALLYTGAALATVWLAVKTVEFVLTAK